MFGKNGCMDMGSLVTANGMSNERKWSFCDLNGKRGTKHGCELKNDRKRNLQVITEVNEILREKKGSFGRQHRSVALSFEHIHVCVYIKIPQSHQQRCPMSRSIEKRALHILAWINGPREKRKRTLKHF